MAHDDDIDELVSSVRDFITRQDSGKLHSSDQKLVLTSDDMVAQTRTDAVEIAEVVETVESNVLRLGVAAMAGGSVPAEPDAAGPAAPSTAAATLAEGTTQRDDADVLPRASGPREVLAGVDEQALRALIERVVREELASELGERMTQNMRKMVRREINRVLTSREMAQD